MILPICICLFDLWICWNDIQTSNRRDGNDVTSYSNFLAETQIKEQRREAIIHITGIAVSICTRRVFLNTLSIPPYVSCKVSYWRHRHQLLQLASFLINASEILLDCWQTERKFGSSTIRDIFAPDFTAMSLYDTLRYEQTQPCSLIRFWCKFCE